MVKLFSIYTGNVNADTGVVSGVSVITAGVEAIGHGIYTDPKTLSQVKACADAMRGGVQVKMDHWSGFNAIVGVLKNFRVELATENSMGDKIGQCDCLRADLHLLKSHPAFEQICEMCAAMPESFGLSISFSGKPETIDEMDFARCTELYSVDLVDRPAANPNGLFSDKVDCKRFSEIMLDELKSLAAKITDGIAKLTGKTEPTELTAVKTDLTALGEKISGELTQLSADLATAKLSVASLTKERDTLLAGKTDFEVKINTYKTESDSLNKFFSEACLNGALIELKDAEGKPLAADATAEVKMAAMLAVPMAQKQAAYAGALNAAFAKANLPNSTLPKAPAKEPGASAPQDNSMKRAEFFKLSPKAQTDFCKNGGKITE